MGIEVTLQGIFDWEQQHEVRPSQLSQQCRDNLLVRERLRKLHHPSQVLLAEAPPEFGRQLPGQRRNNFFTLSCALLLEDVFPNPAPKPPVQHDEGGVHRPSRLHAGCGNHAPQLVQQASPGSRDLHSLLGARHGYRTSTSKACEVSFPKMSITLTRIRYLPTFS